MVNVVMNEHKRFGNPRERINSTGIGMRKDFRQVKLFPGEEELLRLTRAPDTEMEAGKGHM